MMEIFENIPYHRYWRIFRVAVLYAVCNCGLQQRVVADDSSGSWTVLVFEVADNNLDCAGIRDLEEMISATQSIPNQVKVVVMLDRADTSSWDSCGPMRVGGVDWTSSAKEIRLQPAGQVQVLQEWTEVNMADAGVLSGFIARNLQRFPADHYALFMWDHGNDWRGFGGDMTPGLQDWQGTIYPAVMTLPQMTTAIAAGLSTANVSQFSLLGFDACLMQTFSVVASLAPFARCHLASEELEPEHGWDYRASLAALAQTPTMTPEELGDKIARDYLEHSNQHRTDTITLSVINTTSFESFRVQFEEVLELWTTGLEASGELGTRLLFGLAEARANSLQMVQAPGYEDEGLIDMGDFLAIVARPHWKGNETAGLQGTSLLVDLHQAYDDMFETRVQDSMMRRATGMSVYFPRTPGEFESRFCSSIAAVAAWCVFLRKYYALAVTLSAQPSEQLRFLADEVPVEWVSRDDSMLLIMSGRVTHGTAVDAKLRFGYEDAQDRLVFFGDSPAWVSRVYVDGLWDGIVWGLVSNLNNSTKVAPIYATMFQEGEGDLQDSASSSSASSSAEDYYSYWYGNYAGYYDQQAQETGNVGINAPVEYRRHHSDAPQSAFITAVYDYSSEELSFRLYTRSAAGIAEVPPAAGGLVRPFLLEQRVDPGSGAAEYHEYFEHAQEFVWTSSSQFSLHAWHVLLGDLTTGGATPLGNVVPGLDRSLQLQLEARDVVGTTVRIRSSPEHSNTTAALEAIAGATTQAGCRCMTPWTYYDDEFLGTCGNPDSDTKGTWCYTLQNSCPPESKPAHSTWDYCRTHIAIPELVGTWVGRIEHPDTTCALRMTADADAASAECGGHCTDVDYKCAGQSKFQDYYQEFLLSIACTGDGEGFYESYSEARALPDCTFFRRTETTLELWWMAKDLPSEHELAGAYTCEALAAAVSQHEEVVAHIWLAVKPGPPVSLPKSEWHCSAMQVPGEMVGRWTGSASWLSESGAQMQCGVTSTVAAGADEIALVFDGGCASFTSMQYVASAQIMEYSPHEMPCSILSAGSLQVSGAATEMCVDFQRTGNALQLTFRTEPPPRPSNDWADRSHSNHLDIDMPVVTCPGAHMDSQVVVLTMQAQAGSALNLSAWGCSVASLRPQEGAPHDAMPELTSGGLLPELEGTWEGVERYMGFESFVRIAYDGATSTSFAEARDGGEWVTHYRELILRTVCSGENSGFYVQATSADGSQTSCTMWNRTGDVLEIAWTDAEAEEGCDGIMELASTSWGQQLLVKSTLTLQAGGRDATDMACAPRPAPSELVGRWLGRQLWMDEGGVEMQCSLGVVWEDGSARVTSSSRTCSATRTLQLAGQMASISSECSQNESTGRGTFLVLTDAGHQLCMVYARNQSTLMLSYSTQIEETTRSYACPETLPGEADGDTVLIQLCLLKDGVDPASWQCPQTSDASPANASVSSASENLFSLYGSGSSTSFGSRFQCSENPEADALEMTMSPTVTVVTTTLSPPPGSIAGSNALPPNMADLATSFPASQGDRTTQAPTMFDSRAGVHAAEGMMDINEDAGDEFAKRDGGASVSNTLLASALAVGAVLIVVTLGIVVHGFCVKGWSLRRDPQRFYTMDAYNAPHNPFFSGEDPTGQRFAIDEEL